MILACFARILTYFATHALSYLYTPTGVSCSSSEPFWQSLSVSKNLFDTLRGRLTIVRRPLRLFSAFWGTSGLQKAHQHGGLRHTRGEWQIEAQAPDALRNVATYARANKEDFEQLVMQTTSDARKRSLQSGRTELDRIMRRTNELDTLLQKLYEDYALGRLPEKRHAKLSAQYEAEQAQLEQRSAELMERMNAEQEESVNVDRFMELVDHYTDFTELTTPMLNEFIDKVIVYERKKINRYQYDQQIEIYFNFIGKVTLPEEETEAAQEAPKTLHVASNSSFAPIGDYLSAQTDTAIALPFSKVEELTGKPLCKSAYKYASYWYPAQDRPLSNTIYNAGYDVDRVDLAAGIVYLTRAA